MKNDIFQSKHASSIVLGTVAVLIGVASVAGVEKHLFVSHQTQESIQAGALDLVDSTRGVADRMRQIMRPDSNPELFVLHEAEVETVKPVHTQEMDQIRFSGTMTLSDGSLRAILNSGSAAEGTYVRGCLIENIDKHQLKIEVRGEQVVIPLNESYSFKPIEIQNLVLEQVVNRQGGSTAIFSGREGVNTAVFSRRAYRVGDWVDARTRISVITPEKVLVWRQAQNITFTLSNPTGEVGE
jgi:hypothetical protein